MLEPAVIVASVQERLTECTTHDQPVDYATFVPEGEPTLDSNLGAEIDGVASLGVKTAVLTNGSLLWREDVRADLGRAGCVSIKVDTAQRTTWRRLNRPIGILHLDVVLGGMRVFARAYRGDLLTETLLVAGVNDGEEELCSTVRMVAELQPTRAYVTVPTRPPAEPWVRAADPAAVERACQLFGEEGITAIPMIEEIDERELPFAPSVDPVPGLLGIVAVHPMTQSAARAYLARSGADWSVAQSLLAEGRIVAVRHGRRTYLRAARRHAEVAGR